MDAARTRRALGTELGEYLQMATTDAARMLPLWQAFSGGEPVRSAALAAATSDEVVAQAVRSELLLEVDVEGATDAWLRATVSVIPVAIAGELVWVASDFPWYDDDPEAVSGPGAATATLRALVPGGPYRRIADLGSGSGALGVSLLAPGSTLDAVDLNPRAAALTELTAALNRLDVTAMVGDFAEVVSGPYDLVVCNPPFVMGRPADRTLFRDAEEPRAYAGLAHDLAPLLAPAGVAVYLTNWAYGPGLAAPLDDLADDLGAVPGCDLLILERALVTVAEYVRVWTDDASIAAEWERSMAADGITHVGTGAVLLRRTDAETVLAIARPYDVPQEQLSGLAEAWLSECRTARTG